MSNKLSSLLPRILMLQLVFLCNIDIKDFCFLGAQMNCKPRVRCFLSSNWWE